MKKTYYKPMIYIENFKMDIDILAGMTQADLDFARADFEATFADDLEGKTYAEIELIWQQYYLPSLLLSYDNASSGLCYHSSGGLS